MLIISVLGIYPIPVYRGACPIVRRCGLSSDRLDPRRGAIFQPYLTTRRVLPPSTSVVAQVVSLASQAWRRPQSELQDNYW